MGNGSPSYTVSRTNATKFGVTTNGPMLCPGWARCRLRWCEGCDAAGSACPVEKAIAGSHEAHYRRVYDCPRLREQLRNLDELLIGMVNNDLKRRRILFRMNDAWNAGHDKQWQEFSLADRYLAACLNEYQTLLQVLADAQARVYELLIIEKSQRPLMPGAPRVG